MNQQMMGQQNQQQQIMQEPPAILSTKDLSYLKDALSWQLIAMKKCNHFAQETTCPKIKQALDAAGQMHHQHYQTLLKHVDPQKSLSAQNYKLQ